MFDNTSGERLDSLIPNRAGLHAWEGANRRKNLIGDAR
jgi:hypothetical protein